MNSNIAIPELSLIMLVGPSGSGKSTFARKHFKSTEVISSDYCRGIISDDDNNQEVTKDAFELLFFIASKRLQRGKRVVIDATNVQSDARKKLIELARQYHVIPVALVFNLSIDLCFQQNQNRPERQFGKHVIVNQFKQLKQSLKYLKKEGIRYQHHFSSLDEMDAAQITYTPLWNNKKNERGPFDIIGDVHGCFDELCTLLERLGYQVHFDGDEYLVKHVHNRKILFVGDLVDRGPKTPEVLHLVMDMVHTGVAFCVSGNHDEKLKRKLQGREVKVAHGLAESLEQLALRSEAFKKRVITFLDSLISHYVFDDGNLVVAHAGIKEQFIGRGSAVIRDFCMYGEVTGEVDEFGLPVRHPWAKAYRGKAMVVYGHTPIPTPEWINNTINIDTGCVFGGKLTALRYPEKELMSIDAAREYYEPVRPLTYIPAQTMPSDVFDIKDVMGKRFIETKLYHGVTIQEENAADALEVMSRFAIDPRWLIYLPPTMSPPEASVLQGYLEHPQEVFAYYRKNGIREVMCQEKHMGSRVIIIVCKNSGVVRQRFGIEDEVIGTCYSRTGRPFFSNKKEEQLFLHHVQKGLEKANLWSRYQTDWFCLDAELMPWSAKAEPLIKQQYAPVGVAAQVGLSAVLKQLGQAENHQELAQLREKYHHRLAMTTAYQAMYRQYSWPVHKMSDYKIAPFQVLATQENMGIDHDHQWHMDFADALSQVDVSFFHKTKYQVVDLSDQDSCNKAATWWKELTAQGTEGMVAKPLHGPVVAGQLIQPGMKCRGKEYLRLIYGPEYTFDQNLERLRARNVSKKRALALKEYALGYEALKGFIYNKPLYKVHEAAFGILALESEAVDPRL